MPAICFVALTTDIVRSYQSGAPDANHQLPERHIAQGSGIPCRHCLQEVTPGTPYLILAHRPFTHVQPYAELGPIFLHAEPCQRYEDTTGEIPPMFLSWSRLLIRGYNHEERILYGTGEVVQIVDLHDRLTALLTQPEVAFVHIRSATNNCYQCRVERG